VACHDCASAKRSPQNMRYCALSTWYAVSNPSARICSLPKRAQGQSSVVACLLILNVTRWVTSTTVQHEHVRQSAVGWLKTYRNREKTSSSRATHSCHEVKSAG
jgi:hypothetical protein